MAVAMLVPTKLLSAKVVEPAGSLKCHTPIVLFQAGAHEASHSALLVGAPVWVNLK